MPSRFGCPLYKYVLVATRNLTQNRDSSYLRSTNLSALIRDLSALSAINEQTVFIVLLCLLRLLHLPHPGPLGRYQRRHHPERLLSLVHQLVAPPDIVERKGLPQARVDFAVEHELVERAGLVVIRELRALQPLLPHPHAGRGYRTESLRDRDSRGPRPAGPAPDQHDIALLDRMRRPGA